MVTGHVTAWAEADGQIVLQTKTATAKGETVAEAMEEAITSLRGQIEEAVRPKPEPPAAGGQAGGAAGPAP